MIKKSILAVAGLFFLLLTPAMAHNQAAIDFFSPEGVVKGVRQVTARFSEQMVSFGDPRLDDPFEIRCPEQGQGRWIDGKNWSFDFRAPVRGPGVPRLRLGGGGAAADHLPRRALPGSPPRGRPRGPGHRMAREGLPVNLVLLGPPGAGKGTQAKLLAQAFGVPHVSTGDMFRDHKARGTEIGKRIQAVMDGSGLVTDDITNAMVGERPSRPDVQKGFILDGYPRTTAQAEHLERLLASAGRRLERVVSYEIATDLVVERIGGRRSCPRCGAVYHVTANPPRQAGRCDGDQAPLVHRDDDRPENVKRRLEEYAEKTRTLKRFYLERGLVTQIDGVGTPEAILQSTRAALAAPPSPV